MALVGAMPVIVCPGTALAGFVGGGTGATTLGGLAAGMISSAAGAIGGAIVAAAGAIPTILGGIYIGYKAAEMSRPVSDPPPPPNPPLPDPTTPTSPDCGCGNDVPGSNRLDVNKASGDEILAKLKEVMLSAAQKDDGLFIWGDHFIGGDVKVQGNWGVWPVSLELSGLMSNTRINVRNSFLWLPGSNQPYYGVQFSAPGPATIKMFDKYIYQNGTSLSFFQRNVEYLINDAFKKATIPIDCPGQRIDMIPLN